MRWIFLIILALYLGANVYLFVRGINSFPQGVWRIVFSVLFIILSLSFFTGMLFEDKLPIKLVSALQHAGGTWLFSFVYIIPMVLLIDIVRLINKYSPFLPDFFTSNPATRMYLFFSVIGVVVILFVIGFIKFNNPSVEVLNVKTVKNISTKPKIVVASDIHLGYTNGTKKLIDFVEFINSQNPDIVLFCGDTFDRSLRPVKAKNMAEELRKIKAPLGKYVIPGNHEYYGDRDGAFRYLEESGFTVLIDSVAQPTNDIYIVGRDDRTNTKRKTLHELVAGLDHSKLIISLDHQPYNLDEAETEKVDFHFSGHTHDGQIFPINLVTSMIYEKSYGYLQKGNTQYYVTSGLGIWGPHIRIGSRSEIVVLDNY